MEKSYAERNWSGSAEKAAFSDSNAKLRDSVNELCDEFDENKNEVKRNNSVLHLAHGNATSRPVDYSIASLVPDMRNLRLSQQENEPEHLAGYIKAVIPPSATVVIQHAPARSAILDVGTAIFARKIHGNAKHYEEIGFISDIFGSVNEPMYALQLNHRVASELLKLDSGVFYLRDHPSTTFASVERDGNYR